MLLRFGLVLLMSGVRSDLAIFASRAASPTWQVRRARSAARVTTSDPDPVVTFYFSVLPQDTVLTLIHHSSLLASQTFYPPSKTLRVADFLPFLLLQHSQRFELVAWTQ
jgi:hypothetical protein